MPSQRFIPPDRFQYLYFKPTYIPINTDITDYTNGKAIYTFTSVHENSITASESL